MLLTTLNTEAAAAGDQLGFLAATLGAAGEARFRLAQYHRPMWPAVKNASSLRAEWLPVFEQHGLDLGIECDGHVLKRTIPIRSERPDPSGVVYIGEGGLGARQRTPATGQWYLAPPGKAIAAYHVWRLRFEGPRLSLAAIGRDGELLDSAEMTAQGRGN